MKKIVIEVSRTGIVVHAPGCDGECRQKAAAKKDSSAAVSDAYRQGWDNVFGVKQPVGQA